MSDLLSMAVSQNARSGAEIGLAFAAKHPPYDIYVYYTRWRRVWVDGFAPYRRPGRRLFEGFKPSAPTVPGQCRPAATQSNRPLAHRLSGVPTVDCSGFGGSSCVKCPFSFACQSGIRSMRRGRRWRPRRQPWREWRRRSNGHCPENRRPRRKRPYQ